MKAVNDSAPPSIALLPSDIAAWANQYTSVIARHFRLPVEKFRYHEAWKASALVETPVFVRLVTRGNKGIGLEISRNLSGAACTVLLGARDLERGQQAVQTLGHAGHGDNHFIELDVASQDSSSAAAQQIDSRYGHLDILVNNAGVNLRGDGLPGAADLGVVERVFDTNFFGALRVAQATLPLLRKSELGRVVNVSSGLG